MLLLLDVVPETDGAPLIMLMRPSMLARSSQPLQPETSFMMAFTSSIWGL